MARRGKSQARRGGNGGSLPGWAWLLIGAVLALIVVLVVPKYLSQAPREDGFFRPRPNPDARPAISALDEADPPPAPRAPAQARPLPAPKTEPDYDFYTLLPEQETAISDAELAALARAREPARPATPLPTPHPDAAAPATPAVEPVSSATRTPGRYVLQAGAFSSAAEAESLKAQIALLGLQAKIEPGTVDGTPVHRVRLGPYVSAGELAEVKQRLGNGGLSALAVRIE